MAARQRSCLQGQLALDALRASSSETGSYHFDRSQWPLEYWMLVALLSDFFANPAVLQQWDGVEGLKAQCDSPAKEHLPARMQEQMLLNAALDQQAALLAVKARTQLQPFP